MLFTGSDIIQIVELRCLVISILTGLPFRVISKLAQIAYSKKTQNTKTTFLNMMLQAGMPNDKVRISWYDISSKQTEDRLQVSEYNCARSQNRDNLTLHLVMLQADRTKINLTSHMMLQADTSDKDKAHNL